MSGTRPRPWGKASILALASCVAGSAQGELPDHTTAAGTTADAAVAGAAGVGATGVGATTDARQKRQFALLVGCSEYPNLPEHRQLPGCANDVALMRETITEVLAVPADNVRTLCGWNGVAAEDRPTRENILGWLSDCPAGDGDRAIVFLAGHGSYQSDDGSDELDYQDELFCPADVGMLQEGRHVPNGIRDDELGAKIRAIRDGGVEVWLIMDCCHSGSGMRGDDDDVRPRHVSPGELGLTVPDTVRPRGAGAPRLARENENLTGIVAMYAARATETANEMTFEIGGKKVRHGIFTYTLVQGLRSSGGALSFDELYGRTLGAYEDIPKAGTIPLAEGGLMTASVHIDADGVTGHAFQVSRSREQGIALNAGQLHGVLEGSVFAVYEPGRRGDPAALLGHVEVTRTGAVASSCAEKLLEDGPDLPELDGDRRSCPAALFAPPPEPRRLRVAVCDPNGDPVPRADLAAGVRDCFAEHAARIELVDRAVDADWQLELRDRVHRLRSLLGRSKRTFPVGDDELAYRLLQVWRIENLVRLPALKRNALPDGFDLSLMVRRTPDAAFEPLAPGQLLRPGSQFYFAAQNLSQREWHVRIFWLTARHGVELIWPDRGMDGMFGAADQEPIEINNPWDGKPWTYVDDTLGIERVFVMALPRKPASLDWLKMKAFRDLAEDAAEFGDVHENEQVVTRGGAGGATTSDGGFLQNLMFQKDTATRGPRSGKDKMDGAFFVLKFETSWGELAPPPAFPDDAAWIVDARTPVRAPGRSSTTAPQRTATTAAASDGGANPLRSDAPSAAVLAVRSDTRPGHAVLIDRESGVLLTASELVDGARHYGRDGVPVLELSAPSGAAPLRARVIGIDRDRGLARLRLVDPPDALPAAVELAELPATATDLRLVTATAARPARSADSRGPLVDARVQAVAAAYGVDAARIARRGDRLGATTVRVACTYQRGDAGAPLCDASGRLCGVAIAPGGRDAADGAIVVPTAEIRGFLQSDAPERPVPPAEPGSVGPRAALWPAAETTDGADDDRRDVLVFGWDRPAQVWFDFDGDADLGSGGLAEALATRGFDAELALHFEPDRQIAFYDTDRHAGFDLILIDLDFDRHAEVLFRRTRSGWSCETGVEIPWLQVARIGLADIDVALEDRAFQRVAALCR